MVCTSTPSILDRDTSLGAPQPERVSSESYSGSVELVYPRGSWPCDGHHEGRQLVFG